MAQLLHADGRAVSSAEIAAARRPSALAPGAGRASSYRGASRASQELSLFHARHTSADGAARWERQILADRARDLLRNDSLAATAIRKSTAMGVGGGWMLQARPDAYGLGIDPDQARELGTQIERAFALWSTDPRRLCHAARRHDFGGILRTLWGEWKGVGECLALMIWREFGHVGGAYATGVQEIDTDRLGNPYGQTDSQSLRDGIEKDAYGADVAYHIREAHPGDLRPDARAMSWQRVPRETPYGRPVAIYAARQSRAEQNRGITLLAPLVEKFAMRGKMERTELQSALLNAVFAAFVKSGFDPAATAEMLGLPSVDSVTQGFQDVRAGFYEQHPVVMEGITVPILMPGDEVQTNTAGRQASSFGQFTKIVSQSIAAHLGVAEGQITGDYGGLNFSTLRGAYNEIWADIAIERADFGAQVVRPIYLCVLDEAIRRGDVVPPPGCADLFDAPAAWCQSNWIGPARAHIDPEKEAKGDALRLATGVTTRTAIAAGHGMDFEEVARTRAEEAELLERYGQTDDVPAAVLSPSNPDPRGT